MIDDPSLVEVTSLDYDLAARELERLARLIAKLDLFYHQLDAPLISDAEYDALRVRNAAIETHFPMLIRPDSPSSYLGAPATDSFRKVRHTVPMLSLSNAFTAEEIAEFFDRVHRLLGLSSDTVVTMVGEPKIDGLSVSLRYEDGLFVRGATRGDGRIGEDVTTNLRALHDGDLPYRLAKSNLASGEVPEVLEVRGEVYMTRSAFLQLNRHQEKMMGRQFASPRNAAAGSLRQINSDLTASSRSLRLFTYTWGEVRGDSSWSDQWGFLERLRNWGFTVNILSRLCSNVQEVLNFYNYLLFYRSELPYDIDGIVCKVNQAEWQRRLGFASRTPRWAIAYKFPADQARTVVKAITVNVGRTGALTPVALLQPVTIGGVVVSRATLHNEDEVTRKDIRIGDTIIIQRAGDVIPQIVKVVTALRPNGSLSYQPLVACPICHSRIVREASEAVRRCTGGLICSAQVIERLRHFVSRDAFDINGLGEQRLRTLYVNDLIYSPADIFQLETRDMYARIPLATRVGWGEQSVRRLFNSIRARRLVSFERFLNALGIRHIGRTTACILAAHYKDLAKLQSAVAAAATAYTSEAWLDLVSINMLGMIKAEAIVTFFSESHNLAVLNELLQWVTIQPCIHNERENRSLLYGQQIVFTGHFSVMTRKEATIRAVSMGATVTGSVSRKTDYVVLGSSTHTSSKVTAAAGFGVQVMTEQEWLALVDSANDNQ